MVEETKELPSIAIDSFHPLKITFPDEPIVGSFQIYLPPVDIKIYDFELLRGMHDAPTLWSEDNQCIAFKVTTQDQNLTISNTDLLAFIEATASEFEELYEIYSSALSKKALLGSL